MESSGSKMEVECAETPSTLSGREKLTDGHNRDRKRKVKDPSPCPRKSSRERRPTKRVLLANLESEGDSKESADFTARPSKRGRRRRQGILEDGTPFCCGICHCDHWNNMTLRGPGTKSKKDIVPYNVESDGSKTYLCFKCASAKKRQEKKGPSKEQKDEFEMEGQKFAERLAFLLQETEAKRLYCSFYPISKCACIQTYINGQPSRRRKTSVSSSSSSSAATVSENQDTSGSALNHLDGSDEALKRGKYLLSLLRESSLKRMEMKKRRKLSKNDPEASLVFEKFVLHHRGKLRDMGLCERGCQRVLYYSNNFLHKAPMNRKDKPRVKKTKGRAAQSLEKLHTLSCCASRCTQMAITSTAQVAEWRHRSLKGRKFMCAVLREMLKLQAVQGERPCFRFISMVTNACAGTVIAAHDKLLIDREIKPFPSKTKLGTSGSAASPKPSDVKTPLNFDLQWTSQSCISPTILTGTTSIDRNSILTSATSISKAVSGTVPSSTVFVPKKIVWKSDSNTVATNTTASTSIVGSVVTGLNPVLAHLSQPQQHQSHPIILPTACTPVPASSCVTFLPSPASSVTTAVAAVNHSSPQLVSSLTSVTQPLVVTASSTPGPLLMSLTAQPATRTVLDTSAALVPATASIPATVFIPSKTSDAATTSASNTPPSQTPVILTEQLPAFSGTVEAFSGHPQKNEMHKIVRNADGHKKLTSAAKSVANYASHPAILSCSEDDSSQGTSQQYSLLRFQHQQSDTQLQQCDQKHQEDNQQHQENGQLNLGNPQQHHAGDQGHLKLLQKTLVELQCLLQAPTDLVVNEAVQHRMTELQKLLSSLLGNTQSSQKISTSLPSVIAGPSFVSASVPPHSSTSSPTKSHIQNLSPMASSMPVLVHTHPSSLTGGSVSSLSQSGMSYLDSITLGATTLSASRVSSQGKGSSSHTVSTSQYLQSKVGVEGLKAVPASSSGSVSFSETFGAAPVVLNPYMRTVRAKQPPFSSDTNSTFVRASTTLMFQNTSLLNSVAGISSSSSLSSPSSPSSSSSSSFMMPLPISGVSESEPSSGLSLSPSLQNSNSVKGNSSLCSSSNSSTSLDKNFSDSLAMGTGSLSFQDVKGQPLRLLTIGQHASLTESQLKGSRGRIQRSRGNPPQVGIVHPHVARISATVVSSSSLMPSNSMVSAPGSVLSTVSSVPVSASYLTGTSASSFASMTSGSVARGFILLDQATPQSADQGVVVRGHLALAQSMVATPSEQYLQTFVLHQDQQQEQQQSPLDQQQQQQQQLLQSSQHQQFVKIPESFSGNDGNRSGSIFVSSLQNSQPDTFAVQSQERSERNSSQNSSIFSSHGESVSASQPSQTLTMTISNPTVSIQTTSTLPSSGNVVFLPQQTPVMSQSVVKRVSGAEVELFKTTHPPPYGNALSSRIVTCVNSEHASTASPGMSCEGDYVTGNVNLFGNAVQVVPTQERPLPKVQPGHHDQAMASTASTLGPPQEEVVSVTNLEEPTPAPSSVYGNIHTTVSSFVSQVMPQDVAGSNEGGSFVSVRITADGCATECLAVPANLSESQLSAAPCQERTLQNVQLQVTPQELVIRSQQEGQIQLNVPSVYVSGGQVLSADGSSQNPSQFMGNWPVSARSQDSVLGVSAGQKMSSKSAVSLPTLTATSSLPVPSSASVALVSSSQQALQSSETATLCNLFEANSSLQLIQNASGQMVLVQVDSPNPQLPLTHSTIPCLTANSLQSSVQSLQAGPQSVLQSSLHLQSIASSTLSASQATLSSSVHPPSSLHSLPLPQDSILPSQAIASSCTHISPQLCVSSNSVNSNPSSSSRPRVIRPKTTSAPSQPVNLAQAKPKKSFYLVPDTPGYPTIQFDPACLPSMLGSQSSQGTQRVQEQGSVGLVSVSVTMTATSTTQQLQLSSSAQSDPLFSSSLTNGQGQPSPMITSVRPGQSEKKLSSSQPPCQVRSVEVVQVESHEAPAQEIHHEVQGLPAIGTTLPPVHTNDCASVQQAPTLLQESGLRGLRVETPGSSLAPELHLLSSFSSSLTSVPLEQTPVVITESQSQQGRQMVVQLTSSNALTDTSQQMIVLPTSVLSGSVAKQHVESEIPGNQALSSKSGAQPNCESHATVRLTSDGQTQIKTLYGDEAVVRILTSGSHGCPRQDGRMITEVKNTLEGIQLGSLSQTLNAVQGIQLEMESQACSPLPESQVGTDVNPTSLKRTGESLTPRLHKASRPGGSISQEVLSPKKPGMKLGSDVTMLNTIIPPEADLDVTMLNTIIPSTDLQGGRQVSSPYLLSRACSNPGVGSLQSQQVLQQLKPLQSAESPGPSAANNKLLVIDLTEDNLPMGKSIPGRRGRLSSSENNSVLSFNINSHNRAIQSSTRTADGGQISLPGLIVSQPGEEMRIPASSSQSNTISKARGQSSTMNSKLMSPLCSNPGTCLQISSVPSAHPLPLHLPLRASVPSLSTEPTSTVSPSLPPTVAVSSPAWQHHGAGGSPSTPQAPLDVASSSAMRFVRAANTPDSAVGPPNISIMMSPQHSSPFQWGRTRTTSNPAVVSSASSIHSLSSPSVSLSPRSVLEPLTTAGRNELSKTAASLTSLTVTTASANLQYRPKSFSSSETNVVTSESKLSRSTPAVGLSNRNGSQSTGSVSIGKESVKNVGELVVPHRGTDAQSQKNAVPQLSPDGSVIHPKLPLIRPVSADPQDSAPRPKKKKAPTVKQLLDGKNSALQEPSASPVLALVNAGGGLSLLGSPPVLQLMSATPQTAGKFILGGAQSMSDISANSLQLVVNPSQVGTGASGTVSGLGVGKVVLINASPTGGVSQPAPVLPSNISISGGQVLSAGSVLQHQQQSLSVTLNSAPAPQMNAPAVTSQPRAPESNSVVTRTLTETSPGFNPQPLARVGVSSSGLALQNFQVLSSNSAALSQSRCTMANSLPASSSPLLNAGSAGKSQNILVPSNSTSIIISPSQATSQQSASFTQSRNDDHLTYEAKRQELLGSQNSVVSVSYSSTGVFANVASGNLLQEVVEQSGEPELNPAQSLVANTQSIAQAGRSGVDLSQTKQQAMLLQKQGVTFVPTDSMQSLDTTDVVMFQSEGQSSNTSESTVSAKQTSAYQLTKYSVSPNLTNLSTSTRSRRPDQGVKVTMELGKKKQVAAQSAGNWQSVLSEIQTSSLIDIETTHSQLQSSAPATASLQWNNPGEQPAGTLASIQLADSDTGTIRLAQLPATGRNPPKFLNLSDGLVPGFRKERTKSQTALTPEQEQLSLRSPHLLQHLMTSGSLAGATAALSTKVSTSAVTSPRTKSAALYTGVESSPISSIQDERLDTSKVVTSGEPSVGSAVGGMHGSPCRASLTGEGDVMKDSIRRDCQRSLKDLHVRSAASAACGQALAQKQKPAHSQHRILSSILFSNNSSDNSSSLHGSRLFHDPCTGNVGSASSGYETEDTSMLEGKPLLASPVKPSVYKDTNQQTHGLMQGHLETADSTNQPPLYGSPAVLYAPTENLETLPISLRNPEGPSLSTQRSIFTQSPSTGRRLSSDRDQPVQGGRITSRVIEGIYNFRDDSEDFSHRPAQTRGKARFCSSAFLKADTLSSRCLLPAEASDQVTSCKALATTPSASPGECLSKNQKRTPTTLAQESAAWKSPKKVKGKRERGKKSVKVEAHQAKHKRVQFLDDHDVEKIGPKDSRTFCLSDYNHDAESAPVKQMAVYGPPKVADQQGMGHLKGAERTRLGKEQENYNKCEADNENRSSFNILSKQGYSKLSTQKVCRDLPHEYSWSSQCIGNLGQPPAYDAHVRNSRNSQSLLAPANDKQDESSLWRSAGDDLLNTEEPMPKGDVENLYLREHNLRTDFELAHSKHTSLRSRHASAEGPGPSSGYESSDGGRVPGHTLHGYEKRPVRILLSDSGVMDTRTPDMQESVKESEHQTVRRDLEEELDWICEEPFQQLLMPSVRLGEDVVSLYSENQRLKKELAHQKRVYLSKHSDSGRKNQTSPTKSDQDLSGMRSRHPSFSLGSRKHASPVADLDTTAQTEGSSTRNWHLRMTPVREPEFISDLEGRTRHPSMSHRVSSEGDAGPSGLLSSSSRSSSRLDFDHPIIPLAMPDLEFASLMDLQRHHSLSSTFSSPVDSRPSFDISPLSYDSAQRHRNPSSSSQKNLHDAVELISEFGLSRSRNPSSSSQTRGNLDFDSFLGFRSRNPSGSSNRRSRPGSSSSDREFGIDDFPQFIDFVRTRSRNSSGDSLKPSLETLDPVLDQLISKSTVRGGNDTTGQTKNFHKYFFDGSQN